MVSAPQPERTESPRLDRRAEARATTVEDLVHRVRTGRIRVPTFQRGDCWTGDDVRDLLDSVYRGYPIGALLMWERSATAARVQLGPLTIDAPELGAAWWVVDGQQRTLALAGSFLADGHSLPRDPRFGLVFDVQSDRFVAAPDALTEHQVPVRVLLDAVELGDWLHQARLGRDPTQRRRALDAGRRLREYVVPLYVVATDDEEVLREIFFRLNERGHRLSWEEIHESLVTRTPTPSADEAHKSLTALGMGRLPLALFYRAVVAANGLDIRAPLTRALVPWSQIHVALPALRRTLAFLRDRCAMPHLGLVPYRALVYVLARFFALYPEPSSRTRDLLSRWVWRAIDTRAIDKRFELYAEFVRGTSTRSEDAAVQELLLTTYGPRRSSGDIAAELIERLDVRRPDSALVLLALASLGPRELAAGTPIDLSAHFSREQGHLGYWPPEDARMPWATFIHPAADLAPLLEARLLTHPRADDVWTSHAVDDEVLEQLRTPAVGSKLRIGRIGRALRDLILRHARWDETDRPSIAHLVAASEDDA